MLADVKGTHTSQRAVLVASSDMVTASTLGAVVSSVSHCRPIFAAGHPWNGASPQQPPNHFHILLHLDAKAKASLDDVAKWIGGQRSGPTAPSVTVVLDHVEHEGEMLQLHTQLYRAGVKWIVERPLNLRRLRYMIESTRIQYDFRVGSQTAQVSANDHSPDMCKLLRRVEKVAQVDTNLLLLGETGVGKTWWAEKIHQLSNRAAKPFVTVNCASFSPTLVESQMFGHAKGAFTGADKKQIGQFEYAGDGTIFLDEVDSLPLEIQAKLLRVVENREFCPIGEMKPVPMRARIISAANRELEELIAQKLFRSDLFFRLDAYEIKIPPLRNRPEQIVEFCQLFAQEFAQHNHSDRVAFAPDVIEIFQKYDWPGNLRELRNVVQRSAIDAEETVIHVHDLPVNLVNAVKKQVSSAGSPLHDSMPFSSANGIDMVVFNEVERLITALTKNNFNRSKTAKDLGVSRMTVYNLLKRYQLV